MPRSYRSAVLLPLALAAIRPAAGQEAPPRRPAHTYSIVAVDSATRQIGVAVQSHWFSVGSAVAWAEPGVGAVATQSFIEPAYGPRGLALMRSGVPGPAALAALLRADPDSQVRQLAMIDASGRVAAHTGSRAIPAAGHIEGTGYSVQANLMRNDRVWPAMSRAFETTRGDLAERLLCLFPAVARGQESVLPSGPSRPSTDSFFHGSCRWKWYDKYSELFPSGPENQELHRSYQI